MSSGIISAIGGTPLVPLERLFRDLPFSVHAKLELMNPGGSLKDRTAWAMVRDGFANGDLNPNSVVVETSTGNIGIGMAQACNFYGLRFICVVDQLTPRSYVQHMEALGAEVEVVREPDPDTGRWEDARKAYLEDVLDSVDNGAWLQKESNPNNPIAHHDTMREIADALDGQVDYILCGTSTCGTVRGLAEYARAASIFTTVVAVDAVGSKIFDGPGGHSILPGLGAPEPPPLCLPQLIDRVVHVTDLDCIAGCRRLAKREAILAGASSGGIVSSVDEIADEVPEGANVVLILCDRGERYLDTVYTDAWVREHFGDVAERWKLAD